MNFKRASFSIHGFQIHDSSKIRYPHIPFKNRHWPSATALRENLPFLSWDERTLFIFVDNTTANRVQTIALQFPSNMGKALLNAQQASKSAVSNCPKKSQRSQTKDENKNTAQFL
ncbi:hypothetical protein PBAT_23350 [Paenibacillus antarcticus]|uniref:Uncharacterized protein n=1 Tax=Paenibacillus antarcticus TaxID=253703 RepID=A0A162PXR6_9BACL|nr:hypothetical protein PBAT_23350 [Paenibacillus antarcticus]